MDWIRLAIEEFEKRNSISAGMARNQHRELLARIQELETAGRLAYIELENVSNIPVYGWGEEACAAYAGANSKAMECLAALLNNKPLEKE